MPNADGGLRPIVQDWDAAGRLVHTGWRYDAYSATVFDKTVTYWPGGETKAIAYPKGVTVGTAADPWRYDGAGRLVRIPGHVAAANYRAGGATACSPRATPPRPATARSSATTPPTT